jgi:acetylornithine deacetylase/succinyl-diaminopimelate desuccinylase-like protein
MQDYLDKLAGYVDILESIKEVIIANIVLLGQVPSPTFKERRRARLFLERLAGFNVDECTTDGYQNPIGIIRGTSKDKPPIFIVAHMDTLFKEDVNHNFTVRQDSISGPGLLDNAVGVGVLASLPVIFKKLDLTFESDIVMAGVIQSIGKGNLRGIRHLLKTWSTPIRGALILEGGELGRLSYYSYGMIRGEIECNVPAADGTESQFRQNAILVLNEVINQILLLRMPQRPRTRVIFGKISGGHKHGLIAYAATLGFEIQSDSDEMVRQVYHDIRDIVMGIRHEQGVELELKTISNLHAAKLGYGQPLIKCVVGVMERLGLKTVSSPSESELTIFLSHNIPAVTLGITRGKNYHLEGSTMEIHPMFKGIAQIIGVIQAIDSGVCDGA